MPNCTKLYNLWQRTYVQLLASSGKENKDTSMLFPCRVIFTQKRSCFLGSFPFPCVRCDLCRLLLNHSHHSSKTWRLRSWELVCFSDTCSFVSMQRHLLITWLVWTDHLITVSICSVVTFYWQFAAAHILSISIFQIW